MDQVDGVDHGPDRNEIDVLRVASRHAVRLCVEQPRRDQPSLIAPRQLAGQRIGLWIIQPSRV
ncbi:MAG: hypothetical protein ACRDYD_10855 [Acidimicrobiales bacterium]